MLPKLAADQHDQGLQHRSLRDAAHRRNNRGWPIGTGEVRIRRTHEPPPLLLAFACSPSVRGGASPASRAPPCILATNRSATEGVRTSPRPLASLLSSAAERPSKNIATRPKISRS